MFYLFSVLSPCLEEKSSHNGTCPLGCLPARVGSDAYCQGVALDLSPYSVGKYTEQPWRCSLERWCYPRVRLAGLMLASQSRVPNMRQGLEGD